MFGCIALFVDWVCHKDICDQRHPRCAGNSANVPSLDWSAREHLYSHPLLSRHRLTTKTTPSKEPRPWLLFVGFTTIFAALFSKTWQVNKIFHNARRFTRMKVEAKDVMLSYVGRLGVNVIVLLCWTVIAPLVYMRDFDAGTDHWNQKISSYGYCNSANDTKGGFIPHVVILVFVNMGVLVLAIVQAYQARSIRTEYSESKNITIIMTLMLEAFVFAIPTIALVWDEPVAFFTVMLVLISVICFAVLLFMFIPKVNLLREKQANKSQSRDLGINGLRVSMGADDTQAGLKLAVRSSTDIVRGMKTPDLGSEKDDGTKGLRVKVMKSIQMSEPLENSCEEVQSIKNVEEGDGDDSFPGELKHLKHDEPT